MGPSCSRRVSTITFVGLLATSAPGILAGGPCGGLLAEGNPQVTRLQGRDLLAAGWALSEANRRQIERIEEQRKRGVFGPPDSSSGRSRARLAARSAMRNLYHFWFPYISDPGRVYEADAAALSDLFQTFAEPALFTMAHLRSVRMGQGAICAHYDLARRDRGFTVMGGVSIPFEVRDELIEGQLRRVLALTHGSSSVTSYEAVLEEDYGFNMSLVRNLGPPSPYEGFLATEVQGAWIRRWGLHHPTAFMFWASPWDGRGDGEAQLASVRIYIPGLRLELPFLPDLGLDDLRTLDLPNPFLSVAYLRGSDKPPWLLVNDKLELQDWHSVGPLPTTLRARFPDL